MKVRWSNLIVAACIGAGLAASGGSALAQTVKIGWLSSLTGPLSSAAIAENQGVQLAVEEINKAGGILGRQIELLTRDTAGDPTKAVNFAQQLAFSDKVNVVIGPVNSGEGLATTPILARAGVPNIIIGALDELIDPAKYPRAFRAINTNQQWISTANNYAVGTLKRTKVAIIETPPATARPARARPLNCWRRRASSRCTRLWSILTRPT
jgi:branched-chain amino acid transport system substrate-binding protein